MELVATLDWDAIDSLVVVVVVVVVVVEVMVVFVGEEEHLRAAGASSARAVSIGEGGSVIARGVPVPSLTDACCISAKMDE
jgi:hypothetical protein